MNSNGLFAYHPSSSSSAVKTRLLKPLSAPPDNGFFFCLSFQNRQSFIQYHHFNLPIKRISMRAFLQRYHLDTTGSIAFIAVVAVGYLVGVFSGLEQGISATEIGISAVLTLLYLYIGLADEAFFNRYTSGIAKTLYFAVELSLALIIQLFLGAGGSWMIGLPLVGIAAAQLSFWVWRWLVYFAIAAGIFLPIYLVFGLGQAIYFTFTFSPAMLFVYVFTKLTMDSDEARKEAEGLASELENVNRQLADYAAQVEELATTQERNRLAREIHDNVGHYLTVVNVQIRVAKAMMESDPAKAHDALEKAQRLTQEGLSAVRESVSSLRESPVGSRSLPEALGDLLDELAASGIVTEMAVEGEPRPLPPKASLALYRTAQEGLTNVRKHARASRVDLTLDYRQPAQVALCVRDNGVGMVEDSAETQSQSYGLLGIRERVQLLGGEIHLHSAHGEGVALEVTVPDGKEPT